MTIHEKYTAATEEYMRRIKLNNLSEKTIENYTRVLKQFGSYVEQNAEHDADLFALVEGWRDELTEHGSAPSTVCQYLTVLKIFFDKAGKRSFPAAVRFDENPVDEDMYPKIVKRPYDEVLSDDQVIALYRADDMPQFHNWVRNFAMLCLLLNEKIRNAELLDLRLSDLDFAHHELTVQSGKGRKFRIVDMTDLTEQAIARYLDSNIRPVYVGDDDYLFGTTAGHEKGTRTGVEKWHRGTKQWLSDVIERTVRAVTGVENVRSHDLRHVGARICLNAGHSMEELQGQLGHSSVTTTEIYANRLLQRRRRESAKAVLAARDAAAEQLRRTNQREQNVIPFTA